MHGRQFGSVIRPSSSQRVVAISRAASLSNVLAIPEGKGSTRRNLLNKGFLFRRGGTVGVPPSLVSSVVHVHDTTGQRGLLDSDRAAYPFVWQPFQGLFVYARLISQSRGSIPYRVGVEASGQCGCSAARAPY